jgi:hypothetical protein
MTPEEILAGMDSSGRYEGSLFLGPRDYNRPLPAGLTSVGGTLWLNGVIFRNLYDHGGRSGVERTGTVYVAFEPTQIKSALFNQGTYDPKDPDIRKNPRRRTSRPSNTRRKTSRNRKTSRS